MSKQKNRKYLSGVRMRSWGMFVLVAIAASTFIAVSDHPRLSSEVFLVPIGTLVLGAAVLWWSMRRTSRAMARALRLPTPEPLLKLIEQPFRVAAIPDADAFSAQSRAIVLALYGEGERALEVLRPIDWARRAPLIQAAGVVSEGLIALICDGDFARGLRDAHRARALAELTPGTVGSKASNRFYASVLAFAQVLANEEDASTLPTLETSAKATLYPTLQAIAVAGLAAHAHRTGTAADFEARRSQLAAIAPKLDDVFFGGAIEG